MTTAQISQLIITLTELRRERDQLAAQDELTAPMVINDKIIRIKRQIASPSRGMARERAAR